MVYVFSGKEIQIIMSEKVRQSNFELYRIICIFLIVLMHSFGSGAGKLNNCIGIFVNVIGNIGVTGFVLLSGYFGINLKIKKLVKIDIMMIFWSLVNLLVMMFLPNASGEMIPFSIKGFVKCFIPFASHTYWFIACYFALCILSPFINEYLGQITKKQHRKLIMFAGSIYLIMPTVFFFDQTGDGGKGIVNMVLAYVIGRYIGMYHKNQQIKKASLCGMLFAVICINFGLNFVIYQITGNLSNYYARDNSVLTMLQAVLLLLLIMQIKTSSKFINVISSNVIAVYILEDTIKWVISGIMPGIFDEKLPARIFIMIVVTMVTFIVASILEAIRKVFFGKLEDVVINWFEIIIKSIGNRLLSWKK